MTTEAELAAWVREYSDHFGFSFHAKDPTMMRPYCHVPALGIGGGQVNLIATVEESDARWAAAHAGLPRGLRPQRPAYRRCDLHQPHRRLRHRRLRPLPQEWRGVRPLRRLLHRGAGRGRLAHRRLDRPPLGAPTGVGPLPAPPGPCANSARTRPTCLCEGLASSAASGGIGRSVWVATSGSGRSPSPLRPTGIGSPLARARPCGDGILQGSVPLSTRDQLCSQPWTGLVTERSRSRPAEGSSSSRTPSSLLM